jgi:hypothetical protein
MQINKSKTAKKETRNKKETFWSEEKKQKLKLKTWRKSKDWTDDN